MKIGAILWLLVTILSINSSVSQDFAGLYEDLSPSVVQVIAHNTRNNTVSQGSGFFINDAGDIITNVHVVSGFTDVDIITSNGKKYSLKEPLAAEIKGDLFLAAVNIPKEEVHPLKINTTLPKIGEDILVVGASNGLSQTINRGTVSSIRYLENYGTVVQIDAAISPESSGSPVVTESGDTIGIATFCRLNGLNLNFAISSKQVSDIINNSTKGLNQSKSAYASLTKGVSFYVLKNHTEAIKYYDKAIEIDPKQVIAWYNKGVIFSEKGNDAEALNYYNKAIEINPKFLDAWYNKGVIFSEQGNDAKALNCYDNAIEINPKFPDAWYNKVVTLQNRGNYEDAIKCLAEATLSNPNSSDLLDLKGQLLSLLGHNTEAEELFEKANELESNSTVSIGGKNLSIDSLLSIVNITKPYNFDPFMEYDLLESAHKKALESGNSAEYSKIAKKWNTMMRMTHNKSIIDTWTMPAIPEPKKAIGQPPIEEYIPNTTIVYYDISGSTIGDLYRQSRFKGPSDDNGNWVWATIPWHFSWSWKSDENCMNNHAEVHKDVKVIFPRLIGSIDTPPELNAEWNRFVKALAEHAYGHVKIFRENAGPVGPENWGDDCDSGYAADTTASIILDDLYRLNREYDKDTDYGVTQGAILGTANDLHLAELPYDQWGFELILGNNSGYELKQLDGRTYWVTNDPEKARANTNKDFMQGATFENEQLGNTWTWTYS